MARRNDWERDEHDRERERGGYPGDRGRTMEGDWYRQAIHRGQDDRWSSQRREPEEWMRRGRQEDRWDRRESDWDQGRSEWPRERENWAERESWARGRGGNAADDEDRERQWSQGRWPRTSREEWGGGRQGPGYGREDFGSYGREGERGGMGRSTTYEPGGERFGAGSYGYPGGSYGYPGGGHRGKGPKNYRRSDERIREDINERLTDHPDIDASEIDVQVKDGEVTLTGTVDDRRAKRLAEELAEQVWGVQEVHNQIRMHQQREAHRQMQER